MELMLAVANLLYTGNAAVLQQTAGYFLWDIIEYARFEKRYGQPDNLFQLLVKSSQEYVENFPASNQQDEDASNGLETT
jgi:hypothetical protein